MEFEVVVMPDGEVRLLHDDEAVEVLEPLAATRRTTRHISHVEPSEDGGWTADLHPVDGPVLGPFRRRKEAVAAEIEWATPRLGVLDISDLF